jgi:hypothetical protein
MFGFFVLDSVTLVSFDVVHGLRPGTRVLRWLI